MDRIDELVEWTAQLLSMKFPYGYDSPGHAVNWYGLSEEGQLEAIKDAKRILSHPDLALIKRGNVACPLIGRYPYHCEKGYESVIPLPEALKEKS